MDRQSAYVVELCAQMVHWNDEIDRLKDKAKVAHFEAKSQYSKAVSLLQFKRDEAALKLQGISAASDEEWEELRTGTEQLWGEVRGILRDAVMNIN